MENPFNATHCRSCGEVLVERPRFRWWSPIVVLLILLAFVPIGVCSVAGLIGGIQGMAGTGEDRYWAPLLLWISVPGLIFAVVMIRLAIKMLKK
jgi:hypothetical protein